jgi:hypothetical protein
LLRPRSRADVLRIEVDRVVTSLAARAHAENLTAKALIRGSSDRSTWPKFHSRGLEGVRVEFAMVETPDGHGRLELIEFHAPSDRGGDRHAPANTPGIRHLAFAV